MRTNLGKLLLDRTQATRKAALWCAAVVVLVLVRFPGVFQPTELGLVAAVRAQTSSSSPSTQSRHTTIIERAPLQILEDSYPDLSGVALDSANDEIVLVTGQRAATVMAYDRSANTPSTATLLEPKRMISGNKTKLGAPGLYIDPKTSELYSVDTTHGAYPGSGDRIVVFSHTDKGNTAPNRELLIPHRGFALAADETAQELFLTVQNPPAVVVYSKQAKNNDAPLRILEGPNTKLGDVHGIALDTKNRLMYVANRSGSATNGGKGWSGASIVENGGSRTWTIPSLEDSPLEAALVPGSGRFTPPSVTVYPLDASGNVAPLRIIQGPKTQFGWPGFVALDSEHQELFVANSWEHSILVFRASDTGDVAPIRVLKGAKSGLDNPYGMVYDPKHDELIVANYGNHSATVYPRTASGNVAPIRTIRMAPKGTEVPIFQHVSAVDYDSKRGQILVQSCVAQPQMVAFVPGAKGGEKPARTLAGEQTKQGRGMHDMRYDAIHDEIVIANPNAQAVLTFRGGASGSEQPLRIIQGPLTGIVKSDYVELDAVHDELFVPEGGKIMVFARTAVGNVAPIRVLQGPDTQLRGQLGGFLSVDPVNNLLVVPSRGRILIFDRTASGNTKPKAVIEGGQLNGIQHLRVYPPKSLIVAVLGGKNRAGQQDDMSAVAVWSIHDIGNVAPLLLLTDPEGQVPGRKLAFDPKAKEIIVGGSLNVRRYSLPEIF